MANTNVVITSNYAGDPAGVLKTLMLDGNEAVSKGSVHVRDGVQDSLHVSRFTAEQDAR